MLSLCRAILQKEFQPFAFVWMSIFQEIWKADTGCALKIVYGYPIPINKRNVFLSCEFGFFHLSGFSINSIPAMLHAHLLQCIICRFLDMKPVNNTSGTGETAAHNFAHTLRHVRRYFFHPTWFFFRYPLKSPDYFIRRYSFHNGDQSSFSAFSRFIGYYCINAPLDMEVSSMLKCEPALPGKISHSSACPFSGHVLKLLKCSL